MDFGGVCFSGTQKGFYQDLNGKILTLCDALPESVQTDALLFLMKYSGLSMGQKLEFFRNYKVPSWSLVYWLSHHAPSNRLSQKDINQAMTAHAMAMILHSLDDHMNDGQMPATHLTLLLRSQAWMIMQHSLKKLSANIDEGEKIVVDLIDAYYAGIAGPSDSHSLDLYCNLFRQQMATWLITPVLILQKLECDKEYIHSIQMAYESFGIAWRLLDDINDIEMDMHNGEYSAIYVDLPLKMKKLWHKGKKTDAVYKNKKKDIIIGYIIDTNLVERIQNRIIKETQSAVSIFANCGLDGLSMECRYLLEPLEGAPSI